MSLAGKIALVTGGSQGIGESIARRFAQEGARVAIVARGREAAARLAANIESSGGQAHSFTADCSRVADVRRVVDEVSDHFGGLDIVVANAGTFRTVSIAETTEEIWDEQVDLNLKGTFFLVQAVTPHLERRGGGKIILISSIAGVRGFVNCPAYCASKGGVVNMTKAMALELAPKGININTIAPGNTETPINAHLRGPENAEYMKLMSDRTPTGRAFIRPDELSGVAAFLASDDASAMHGSVVVVDDGWCAW
jgi:NAD(P)-dependent dehydrogenase (short-subunit alcohol dehydrogenase family)